MLQYYGNSEYIKRNTSRPLQGGVRYLKLHERTVEAVAAARDCGAIHDAILSTGCKHWVHAYLAIHIPTLARMREESHHALPLIDADLPAFALRQVEAIALGIGDAVLGVGAVVGPLVDFNGAAQVVHGGF